MPLVLLRGASKPELSNSAQFRNDNWECGLFRRGKCGVELRVCEMNNRNNRGRQSQAGKVVGVHFCARYGREQLSTKKHLLAGTGVIVIISSLCFSLWNFCAFAPPTPLFDALLKEIVGCNLFVIPFWGHWGRPGTPGGPVLVSADRRASGLIQEEAAFCLA